MTADPPRQLRPGEHFDLGIAVLAVLDERFSDLSLRWSLFRRFGMPPSDQDTSWLDDILAVGDRTLFELAEYLGVPLPADVSPVAESPSASDIDAYAELVSAETALRDVIRIAVPLWQSDYTPEDIKKLGDKRAAEDKRRDGIAVSQDLLDYTEIYELQKLINKHWDSGVQAVLDDKKRTDVYLGVILDVRNSIGHSRPVFQAERCLLAGAAGQIRNQLARYRAKADGPQRHYPSLDSARDSMGTVAPPDRGLSGQLPWERDSIPRLEVGDTVTFELEATDPRGRELVWRVYSVPGHGQASMTVKGDYYPIVGEMTGARVTLTWTVEERDVGEAHMVVVVLSSAGRFHRQREYDDGCVFHYHVNPPPDA